MTTHPINLRIFRDPDGMEYSQHVSGLIARGLERLEAKRQNPRQPNGKMEPDDEDEIAARNRRFMQSERYP